MRPYLLLPALALTLLAGCHGTDPTTGTTTVSGQVVQYQTTKGVPNATVQVYHASSGGGYVPVGPGYPADTIGHFAFHTVRSLRPGWTVRKQQLGPHCITSKGPQWVIVGATCRPPGFRRC